MSLRSPLYLISLRDSRQDTSSNSTLTIKVGSSQFLASYRAIWHFFCPFF